MSTNPNNLPEEKIRELLDEFFKSGYGPKDFCYFNEKIDEATLRRWVEKYRPDKLDSLDNGFADIRVNGDLSSLLPQQQPPAQPRTLFARIGYVEIYGQVPADYLKSLSHE
jgi:hypothetical protein